MLVLMRRPGEEICVGDDIRFTVLGIQGNQVRIGIQAPRHVSVDREEIYVRKQRDRRRVTGGLEREPLTRVVPPSQRS